MERRVVNGCRLPPVLETVHEEAWLEELRMLFKGRVPSPRRELVLAFRQALAAED